MEMVLQYPFQRTSPPPTLLARPTQFNSQSPAASQIPKVCSISKSTKAPYRQEEVHLSRSVEHPSHIQTVEAAHGHSIGQPLPQVAEHRIVGILEQIISTQDIILPVLIQQIFLVAPILRIAYSGGIVLEASMGHQILVGIMVADYFL